MLSAENNNLITKVGPGTPMGETMRLYWIPIMMDFELPHADCDPVRVRILGEDLVAFRDSKGRIGLLPDACPHRRVSLYFGRKLKLLRFWSNFFAALLTMLDNSIP